MQFTHVVRVLCRDIYDRALSMTQDLYTSRSLSEDSIRLLRLHAAATRSDDIVCDLLVISREKIPQYEAVSYTWGDPLKEHCVIVSKIRFPVTRNLQASLRLLRLQDASRLLWIDAICINQDDVEERNFQVLQMGRIYSEAEQVIIPVLLNCKRTTLAAMQQLGGKEDQHWLLSLQSQEIRVIKDNWEYLGIYCWLRDKWWTRIWTVQEAILGKKLTFVQRCGTVSGETIFRMANNFIRHMKSCCREFGFGALDLRNELLWKMQSVNQLEFFRNNVQRRTFLELITSFHGRDSLLNHDKIYAFLGVFAADWSRDFVSYDEDFPKTFERTTKEIIRRSRNLDVLSHNIGPDMHVRRQTTEPFIYDKDTTHPNATYQLPSWVPDWNMNTNLKLWNFQRLRLRLQCMSKFSAARSTEWTCDGDDVGVLLATGFTLDTITFVGKVHWGQWELDEDIINEWKRIFYNHEALRRSSKRDPEAVWWETITGGMCRSTFENHEANNYGSVNVTAHVRIGTMNRRFFISKQGYSGLGPWSLNTGDRLCILHGGKMPYAVRDNTGGDESIQTFLGDVYCHELMCGEAMVNRIFVLQLFKFGFRHPTVQTLR